MANIRTGRKSGFILRSGVMRRETVWLGIAHASATLAASATAALTNASSAMVLALRPFTIVRTRGTWLVLSDQSAASESFIGSIGYSVVSDQALAVGIGSVPTPATDQSSDMFFVYESWEGHFDLIGTDITQNLVARTFDSKAMRKVDDGQDIAFAAEAGIGGTGCIVKTNGRMLVKLH